MAYAVAQWVITPEERARSDSIFLSLKPQGGYLTGQQARDYFLQSKLPLPVLGHIWGLADVDKDGRMTADEFAVAMHLLQAKIRGIDPPATLPPSLMPRPAASVPMVVPMVVQTGGIPMSVPVAIGGMSAVGAMPASVPTAGIQPTAIGAAAPGEDWIVSHAERLKYNQMFNQLDQRRAGSISGLQAKPVLVNSGLPQALLAQIWSLSDVDKDGSLTSEEFALAMHLINRAKSGVAIPAALNDEMLPPSVRKQRAQQQHVSSPKPEPSAGPDIEDRLRENFKLGQAELERRRKEAEDMERKQREEVERKQREEEERKRELERLRREQEEKERQRQLEAELARQKERERMIEEERRREEDRRRRDELLSWARRARTALEDLKERELEARRRAQLAAERLREELASLRARRGPLQSELELVSQRLRDERVATTRAQEELNVRTMALDEVKFECDETRTLIAGLVDQKRSLQRQIEMIQEALAGNNNTQRMQALLQGVRDSVERLKIEVRTLEADVTIKRAEQATRMTQGQTLRAELVAATRIVEQLTERKRVLLEAEIGRAKEEHMREMRERRDREERARREREEKERKEREDRAKREKEERDRQEKERREREERDRKEREEKERKEKERREREAREQKEREEREQRERKAREEAAAASALAASAAAATVSATTTTKKAPPVPTKVTAQTPAKVEATVQPPPTPAKPTAAATAVASAAPPATPPKPTPPALPPKEGKPKVGFAPEPSVIETPSFNGAHEEPAAEPEPEKPAEPTPASNDVYYRAIYAYTAANHDELSFSEGALIRYVNAVDADWVEGELNGVTGLFPLSYVELQQHGANGAAAAGVVSDSDILAKLEEENRRVEDEKRKAETLMRIEAENRRLEEAQRRKEEARRKQEEEDKKKRAEEEKKRAEEERKKKEEEEKKRKAAALEEEKRRKAEEERKRKEEEERKKKEEEERKRKAAEEEKKRKEEEERKRKEEEEKKKKAAEDEKKRKAEEEERKKKAAEEEKRRKEEEERSNKQAKVAAIMARSKSGTTVGSGGALGTALASSATAASLSSSASNASLPSAGERFVALYSYAAQNEDEVSFNAGDAVAVVEKGTDGWWKGTVGGATGYFPANYVEEAPPEPVKPAVVVEPAAEYMVALYAYAGGQDGDLTFNAGDSVRVLQKSDNGWWEGECNGLRGWFPSTHVQADAGASGSGASSPAPGRRQSMMVPGAKKGGMPVIAKVVRAYNATSETELSLQLGQLIQIKTMDDPSWWEGTAQSRGKKKETGWFPADCVQLMEKKGSIAGASVAAGGASAPALGARAAARKSIIRTGSSHSLVDEVTVTAKFAYTAQKGDELSFIEGDSIVVRHRDDSGWWEGELNGQVGYFPISYCEEPAQKQRGNMVIQEVDWATAVGPQIASSVSAAEAKRQNLIFELIFTEQSYVKDLELVMEVFYHPMRDKGLVTKQELHTLFINWEHLLTCNQRLVAALVQRQQADQFVVKSLGDILVREFPQMEGYIQYCSGQAKSASFLSNKTGVAWIQFLKKVSQDPRTLHLPLSSFLLKPMQRITKYPLLLQKIKQHTPPDHPDYANMSLALEKSEALAAAVNEGVRRKESEQKLKWIQAHLNTDTLTEKLDVTSDTNSIGPRQYLHEGCVFKLKSGKELYMFLFNDLVLMTLRRKPMLAGARAETDFQFTIYKKPIPVHMIAVKDIQSQTYPDCVFQIIHSQEVHNLRTESPRDRKVWIDKLTEAHRSYLDHQIQTAKGRTYSQSESNLGTLTLTVVEGINLMAADQNGKSDPYCVIKLGDQCVKTKVIKENLNPRWNSEFFLTVTSLDERLNVSVYDQDEYSKDDFLGSVEFDIRSLESMDPFRLRRLQVPLEHVNTGEIVMKVEFNLKKN